MEITAYTPPEACRCRSLSGKRLLSCVLASKTLRGKATDDRLSKIQVDLIRVRRLLMVEGTRVMMPILRDFLEERLREFASRVTGRLVNRAAGVTDVKADEPDPTRVEIDLTFSATTEAIWARTLDEVLGEAASIQLMAVHLPAAQSLAARSYERTCIVLGEELAVDNTVTILRRAQTLAREVTSINETTRKHLAEALARGVEEGSTPYEIAQQIKAEAPEIAAKRLPTIIRTEVGRALDEGTKQAMIESNVITHVSVTGCKGREPGSPTYRGESTCNIKDVPVYDVDKLRFHPNHTGVLVPSRFVGER